MRSLVVVVFALIALQAVADASSGAIYTATQGTPNMLNIYSVNSSGHMNYVKQIATGGNGGALGSQGSIVVSGNFILAVNPASNNVALFYISATDPTDVSLLSVANTTYDFPNSVTVYGSTACVVTSGATNGVECFTITTSEDYTNTLVPISTGKCSLDLTLTTPPAFHTGPAQISFSPDGKALIVAIKNTTPRLEGPSVYLFTTPLTAATCASVVTAGPQGNVPFGFAIDNNYVVLTDAAPFGGNGGVIPLSYTSNSISYAANFTVLNNALATCWAIWNPNTGLFYTANSQSASISSLSRAGSTMSMIASYTAGTGNVTIEGSLTDMIIATLDGKDYLYVSAGNHVHAYQLGTAPGIMQSMSTPAVKNSGMASYVMISTTTTVDTSTTTVDAMSTSSTAAVASTSGATSVLVATVVVLGAILAAF